MASPPYTLDAQNIATLNIDQLKIMIAQLYALIGGGVAALGTLMSDSAPGSGPINNYAPPGFGAATGRLDITPPAGGTIINGISPGFDGQLIAVSCRSATDGVQFNNEAAGPSATWRIQTPGDSFTLSALEHGFLYYTGGAINRWRVL